MDLEHSFGPAYVRGRLLRGTAADAVIGVGEAESAAVIDGILTLGILWLDYCRQNMATAAVTSADSRSSFRPAHGAPQRSAWHGSIMPPRIFSSSRSTNAAKSSPRSIFATPAILNRGWCMPSPPTRRSSAATQASPADEPRASGRAGVAWRFARARRPKSVCCCMDWNSPACVTARRRDSFARENEVTFGAGAERNSAHPRKRSLWHAISSRGSSPAAIPTARTPIRSSACSRSVGLNRVSAPASPSCCPSLRGDLLYTQVPALSSGDRGMLDLLTLDRNGRLAVLELKADEDLHLPLQALDYWIRVRALNADRAATAGSDRPALSLRAPGLLCRSRKSRPCRRGSCSPRPRCAFIPPTKPCCATSRPRSSGS